MKVIGVSDHSLAVDVCTCKVVPDYRYQITLGECVANTNDEAFGKKIAMALARDCVDESIVVLKDLSEQVAYEYQCSVRRVGKFPLPQQAERRAIPVFTCPKCKTMHSRGPINGDLDNPAFRCLKCGETYP